MTSPEGGFFSAEDADSAADPRAPISRARAHSTSGAPKRFGIEPGQPAADWFCYRYGVEAAGNVAADPPGEFTGKNILYQAHTVEETAERFERPLDEVCAGLLEAGRLLLEARSKRVRPHLDDKILTAWNGLMISAFARGGAALDEPRYAAAARRASEFLIARMCHPQSGALLRRYRQGEAAIPAFLDDYALFAQGLLDLYEAQFDRRDLELAIRLTEKQMELFEDPAQGAFFASAADDASLVMRVKEDYDGAEPSGNSIAAMNLLRLARFTIAPISANRRKGHWRLSHRAWRRRRLRSRRCWPPASGCWASRARSSWLAAGTTPIPRRFFARSIPASFPTGSSCWWIPLKPAAPWPPAFPPLNHGKDGGPRQRLRLPELHLPITSNRSSKVRRVIQ